MMMASWCFVKNKNFLLLKMIPASPSGGRRCTSTAATMIMSTSTPTSSIMIGRHFRFPLLVVALLFIMVFSLTKAQNYEDYENSEHHHHRHCMGEWKYPFNCSTFNCDYKATWEYRDENDEIIFSISTRNRNKWTGIGFSDNQAMPNTDTVLGLVEESGRFFLMDSYLQAYEAPPLDQQQNLYNMSAWRENGLTTLRFSRPRQTGDPRDYQFTDTNCPYFIFPVMGGVFNAVNKRIRKHESTPVISDKRICVKSCRTPTTTIATTITNNMKSSTSTTTKPTTLNDHHRHHHHHHHHDLINTMDSASSSANSPPDVPVDGSSSSLETEKTKVYQAELKFLNLINTDTGVVEESFFRELKPRFDRIRRIEINEMKNDPNNNIAIVDLTIAQPMSGDGEQQSEEKEDVRALTAALTGVLRDNRIGKWMVDPNHLVVTPKDTDSTDGWLNIILGSFNRFSDEEQKWIIIGAGLSALVLLALIQLLCMFCSCNCCGNNDPSVSKQISEHDDYVNEKDNVDKQWKEYGNVTSSEHYPYGTYDDYGGGGGYHQKSNSLHKNHRDHHDVRYSNNHHHHHTSGGHYQQQSLDRRHYGGDQQVRRNGHGPYEMNERQSNHHHHHHHHRGPATPGTPGHHLQPDFYFMPHQRKYSSDVVRVYVDYDGN